MMPPPNGEVEALWREQSSACAGRRERPVHKRRPDATCAQPVQVGEATKTGPNMLNRSFWKGRRVFLTGHTGFKGGWLLSLWLNLLEADVTGFALDPPTQPSLFEQADVGGVIRSLRGDIRDYSQLADALEECRPEVVHSHGCPIRGAARLWRSHRDVLLQCHGHGPGTVRGIAADQKAAAASSSTSPATSATKIASSFGDIAKTSLWAATIHTLTPRVARNS